MKEIKSEILGEKYFASRLLYWKIHYKNQT